MNFGQLKTQVQNKIDYGDQTTKVPTYINSAIHILEEEDDWSHMESALTGNLTTSVDYIAIPTRYKSCKNHIFITDGTRQKAVVKADYGEMLLLYPDGSSAKSLPKRFARKESESKFIVRPYPEKTYAYELLANVYSADLVADADSNWWTANKWELVMYGALIQYELDSGAELKLGTEEMPLSPVILYTNLLTKVKNNNVRERVTQGVAYSSVAYVH